MTGGGGDAEVVARGEVEVLGLPTEGLFGVTSSGHVHLAGEGRS